MSPGALGLPAPQSIFPDPLSPFYLYCQALVFFDLRTVAARKFSTVESISLLARPVCGEEAEASEKGAFVSARRMVLP